MTLGDLLLFCQVEIFVVKREGVESEIYKESERIHFVDIPGGAHTHIYKIAAPRWDTQMGASRDSPGKTNSQSFV